MCIINTYCIYKYKGMFKCHVPSFDVTLPFIHHSLFHLLDLLIVFGSNQSLVWDQNAFHQMAKPTRYKTIRGNAIRNKQPQNKK